MKPAHVAIIMDGNGRWATARGLPRTAGHKAGIDALRRTVNAAGTMQIPWLTLYAFSSENWSRPKSEVTDLMGLLRMFIRRDLAELNRNGVRMRVIGSRAGLEPDIAGLLVEAETVTAGNTGMNLVIAFNYGSRDEITRAARALAHRVKNGELDPDDITVNAFGAHLDTAGIPDPDLIIRTGGEQRLSNFLLWQAAYAEFIFLPCYWPDFGEEEFAEALRIFEKRTRRFGGIETREAIV